MRNVELQSFVDPQALVVTVAEQLLNAVEGVVSGSEPYCLALSGGRIARLLFETIARRVKAHQISLEPVHFFWADERCVPPRDPESNYGIANQLLLAPLKISARQIHRVQGELSPQIASVQAQAELLQIAPAGSAGQPIFDLILLGMGEDGHVASLFPGESEELMTDSGIYRAVLAAKPPPERVTLGYPAIAAARQVWVLASGPGKERALRESLSLEGQTPLSRVLKLRSSTRIFTDISQNGTAR